VAWTKWLGEEKVEVEVEREDLQPLLATIN